ncbi:MAG: Gfo/Idh/MocA family oxidoreductase [Phycisphaerae bacterium]|nr:Gfo/Idh/MocA family oxidoreductase [Phycisphaerae bacterium]
MGISIGVVGCGRFAPGFIRLFRDHPMVDRVALCDIEPERVKENLKTFELTEGYDSLEEVCSSDLDAVVIMTQPWLHAPQAIQAMEAGKHVWSAVPLTMLPSGDEVLDWCDKVIETSRRTGMHYFLAETSYYYPAAMYCRRRAAEGAFGEFTYAEGKYTHDYRNPQSHLVDIAKHRWGDNWDMSKSGATPMHYPTHSISGFLSVMNTHVTKVACLGYEYPNDEWFRKDTIFENPFCNEIALLRLNNGVVARFAEFRRDGSWCYEGFEQLCGTEGGFYELGEGNGKWATKHEKELKPVTVDEMRDPLPPEVLEAFEKSAGNTGSVYGGHQGSHAYLVHEFVDALATGRPPAITAWESVRYLAPGIMAHKSAMKDGEWLEVPDWGDAPK